VRDERQPASDTGRANLVLATLFVGAFAVGCAEMLVVGVLDLLAISIKPTRRVTSTHHY
jgi:MFS transporter, DHA1 family, inner membrane transport protein